MALTLFTTPVSAMLTQMHSRSCLGIRADDDARGIATARSHCSVRNCLQCCILGLVRLQGIPNPDLVHAYMAECGIGEDKVKLDVVNVMAGENRSPEFLAKNPQGTVPALALADGRVMAESTMICQYLDEIYGPTS